MWRLRTGPRSRVRSSRWSPRSLEHEQLFTVAVNERKVHHAASIVTESFTGIGDVVGVLTWSHILSVTSYGR